MTYATDAFEGLEYDTVDTRFRVRGTQEVPPNLAVIAIDDVTFNELEDDEGNPVRWPFPRDIHGDLVRLLDEAGAGVIAYDVQFTEPSQQPREDFALVRAVDDADKVVLATEETNAQGGTRIFGGDRVLNQIGARAGNSQLPAGEGGVFRKLPYSTRGLESFSVVAADLTSDGKVDPADFEDGGAWINYLGETGTIPTYSFSKVLYGDVPAEEFEGKTVVVGASAPSLQDIAPTPFGADDLMPGAEIQANGIATVLDDFPLGSAPGVVNVALIALLGLVVPAASLRLSQWACHAVAVGAALLFLVGAQLAFNAGSIVVVVYPLVALLFGVVGSMAVRSALLALQLRRQERIIRGELEPGAEFAGHTIDKLAGRGGMGVLYLATHATLGVKRAIKMIAPEHAEDLEFRERFERESRLAALIEHPHVIPINDVGEEDGLLYISMRFIEGQDMAELIASEGRLDPLRAATLVDQVGYALDAAHEAGLIHRDVKPANVLIEQSARGDHAYLTDFGLTKSMGEASMTATGMIVGTVDYMPPEQFEGESVDHRVDVYALGCVLYRSLTGRVPFERDSYQAKMFAHIAAEPPPPTDEVPTLPLGFDRVIEKAMAKNPDDRYQTAGELGRAALEAAAGASLSSQVIAMPSAAGSEKTMGPGADTVLEEEDRRDSKTEVGEAELEGDREPGRTESRTRTGAVELADERETEESGSGDRESVREIREPEEG